MGKDKNKKSYKKVSKAPHGEDILSPEILNQITKENEKNWDRSHNSPAEESAYKIDHSSL